MKQREAERLVFGEFAELCKMSVTSIDNREPPEPDIFCVVSGVPFYFELTRGTDETFNRILHTSERGFSTFNVFPGTVRKIRHKLATPYKREDAAHIDLLVYFEEPAPHRHIMDGLIEWAEGEEAVRKGQFERLWFYDRSYRGIIGLIQSRPFQAFRNKKFGSDDFRVSIQRSTTQY